jgi:hypothetical protein
VFVLQLCAKVLLALCWGPIFEKYCAFSFQPIAVKIAVRTQPKVFAVHVKYRVILMTGYGVGFLLVRRKRRYRR